ncbi:MAG: hypothetical protein ABIB79_04205 [archaeon]
MKQIITPSENKIAQEFFKEYTNSTTVTKKLYPDTSSKTLGIVGRASCKWRKKEYFYEEHLVYIKKHEKGKNKGQDYAQAGPKFIFNLNVIFDYLFEKGVKLSQSEKNYLDLLFSHPHIRKAVCELYEEDELRNAIIKFYLNFLVFPCVLKDEYISNKNKISENIEYFEGMETIFLDSREYRKKVKLAIKNACKISNTKAITKICKNNLKEIIDDKIIKPIEYSQSLLRPLYLTKHEDEKDGIFIKRLNMRMMKGFGVNPI